MLDADVGVIPEPPCTAIRPELSRAADPPERPADLAQRADPAQLTHEELRAAWRRLWRSQPPKKLGRDLLELGIAWKEQEQALGGLGAVARRRLAELARTIEANGDLARARAVRLRPGARLLRSWRGVTHEVLVLEDGFCWRGEHWRSLSAIAREITGARWSGPRFFGLGGSEKAAGPPRATAARVASEGAEEADA
ncbi:MAG TPA: DUF2924 domain-containing protein [Thermohalobaculum sp.]|nr:DUF2924 domain-containing protein [Thermohalobaculum sp.]